MRDISSIHALFIGVVKGFMKRRRTLACTENTAFCKILTTSVLPVPEILVRLFSSLMSKIIPLQSVITQITKFIISGLLCVRIKEAGSFDFHTHKWYKS